MFSRPQESGQASLRVFCTSQKFWHYYFALPITLTLLTCLRLDGHSESRLWTSGEKTPSFPVFDALKDSGDCHSQILWFFNFQISFDLVHEFSPLFYTKTRRCCVQHAEHKHFCKDQPRTGVSHPARQLTGSERCEWLRMASSGAERRRPWCRGAGVESMFICNNAH